VLKIKCDKNKLVLFQKTGESLSFGLFDKKFFEVIKRNIESSSDKECFVSVEKKSNDRSFLILSWDERHEGRRSITPHSMKLVIPDMVAYEISSRMLLLSKSLKVPGRTYAS